MGFGPADMQSKTAKVTALIRTYNRRDKTLRAIASAVNQTIPNLPIILVDDASTDGTAEAVRERYGERVAIVQRPRNEGPGAAANSGLALVETEFIAFLDSDDTWHPTFVEELLAAAETQPGTTMAYCDVRRVYQSYFVDRPGRSAAPESVAEYLAAPVATMSVMLVRTRSARSVGGFDVQMQIGEDFDFCIRLWIYAPYSFVHVRQELVTYNISTDNISHRHDETLRNLHTVVDRFTRHPVFAHLADRKSEIIMPRALRIAGRKQIERWLQGNPKRTVSLILFGGQDPQQIANALDSVALQRLPPTEVVLAVPPGTQLDSLLSRDWPFQLLPMNHGEDADPGVVLQNALAACTGSLITFLEPGDRFAENALDDHRRAFASSLSKPCFSYGGTEETPVPCPLSFDIKPAAKSAALSGTPGTLSAMAVERKRLLEVGTPRGIAPGGLWLFLVGRLLDGLHPPVRIRRTVAVTGNRQSNLAMDLAAALETAGEAETGNMFAGLADELRDGLEHSDDAI